MNDTRPPTELEDRIRRALRERAAAFTPVAGTSGRLVARPRAAISSDGSATAVLDDALGVLQGTGPEYDVLGSGFCLANHGTMVAEALCSMGRHDAVLPWVERYRSRLSPPPAGIEPIVSSDWRRALGNFARATDWTRYFDAELAERGWVDTANRWILRLAPGTYGGMHGAIRTAHAVRSLASAETSLRVHELGEGLAYWASQYGSLPETRGASSGLLPSKALRRVEQLGIDERTGWLLFTQPIDRLRFLPSFASAVDLVDLNLDQATILSDLTEAAARILISNVPTVNPRGLCHALTGGAMARMMLGSLSDETAAMSLRYGWQLTAAFYAAIVLEPPEEDVDAPSESIDDLFEEALDCPDEHGIKVLEACLREYALDPNPVYLVAARDTTRRLREVGLTVY